MQASPAARKPRLAIALRRLSARLARRPVAASLLAMASLCAAAQAAAAPPMADATLDAEPNDSFVDATPVLLPMAEGAGCIDPATDVDMYTFTVLINAPLWVSAKGAAQAHMNVAIFDHSHQSVAEGMDMVDVPDLDAGTYFIRLTAPEQTCYSLHLFAESRQPPLG